MIEDDYQEDGEYPVCEMAFWLVTGLAVALLGTGLVQFLDWWAR